MPDASLTNEQRIVLLSAAEHLDGTVDLRIASDHGIDLAVPRFLVEVDAVGLERLPLLLGIFVALGLGFFIDASNRARFGNAGPLGDAVADVVDRVIAGHVLLLQEVSRVAFAFGENRDQDIRTGDLFPTGRLNMNDRALNHALKSCGRLGVIGPVRHQIFKLGLKIVDEAGAQLVEIDAARSHDRCRIGVIHQRQQEVLQRRVLMVTLVCNRQRAVQRLFKALGKSRHSVLCGPPPS